MIEGFAMERDLAVSLDLASTCRTKNQVNGTNYKYFLKRIVLLTKIGIEVVTTY